MQESHDSNDSESVMHEITRSRVQAPAADAVDSPASLPNAASALRTAPSLVANASTVLREGTRMSSAYHIVLLPLWYSTGPPTRSLSTSRRGRRFEVLPLQVYG